MDAAIVTANWRKNSPEIPLRKAEGQEHSAQRQCDREQRPAHFVHRTMRGFLRRHARAHVALHILDHHNRIVDYDTDRKYKTEQREIVQRYPECRENDERSKQGDGDRDDRDHRGSPALKEQEDDADHEQNRHEDRDDHLIDGLADENCRIVNDLVGHA